MRIFVKNIQKSIAIAAILAFLIQMSASAYNGAVLKSIKIDMVNNQDYRITIKTDKDVPIKKYITASNKVALELEDIKPAQFVNTVYGNAAEVDHVIVQPSSGDKIRIFIQGLNIASSKIILDTRDEAIDFLRETPAIAQEKSVSANNLNSTKTFSQENVETSSPKASITAEESSLGIKTMDSLQSPDKKTAETSKIEPEQIVIDLSDTSENNSIDKVKSISPALSYEEKSVENFNIVKNSMSSEANSGRIFETSIFDWVLRFLTLGIIIAASIKMFRKPKNIEIDLTSQKMKSRELDIYKAAETRKELLTRSLGMTAYKETAVRKPNYSSISQYGLKEYQNSQLPPQRLTPLTPPERNIVPNKNLNYNPQINKTTSTQSKPQSKTRQMGSTKVTQKQTEDARKNFDGVKFLESMATIYQKSGRTDLASGIRQNLIKKQQSI
ncbi:MAG TPA: hypothetical protein P5556_11150 [Candidatus Gastranaerophilales bacterium]|nr:hypothetical protein [Candidatus Gastranaerophilales bacterium]